MNTPDFPTPGDYHDPELAPLADTLRPVVDKGHARRLALEIVRLAIAALIPGAMPVRHIVSAWYAHGISALSQWYACAADIDAGKFVPLYQPRDERDKPPAMTLLDVAGAADRIASIANQRRKPGTWHGEAGIVYDLATALRRACGCGATSEAQAFSIVMDRARVALPLASEAIRARAQHHEHTARTLLPLLVRDVREMLRDARVDGADIEAAIVAHGGTPS